MANDVGLTRIEVMMINPNPRKNAQGISHSSETDHLIVLAVMDGHRATKLIRAVANSAHPTIEPFDAGYKYYVLNGVAVDSIFTLSETLHALAGLPNMLAIRGQPEPTLDVSVPQRRLGSGDGAAFHGNFRTPPSGRRYMLIDFDKVALPSGLELLPETAVRVCEYLVSLLPKEFSNISYHYQLSSSAGLIDNTVASVHIWFWLAQPIPDHALKRWAKVVNGKLPKKLIDDALFQHVQAHYTANPIFDGMPDPFPVRSGLVKKERDSVVLVMPPAEIQAVSFSTGKATGIRTTGRSGFECHLSRIGDHDGGDGFHGPVRDAAASYIGTHGFEGTDEEALYLLLRDRVLSADHSRHDSHEVEHRASREHIEPIIASAIQKFGQEASRRRKSRRVQGIAPHFPALDEVEVDITTRLKALIRGRG
jgi:hypothetical protein